MSNTDADDPNQIEKQNASSRESLILTAVNFLQNPNVRRSPLSQKQKFLRSKGLTENEIQIACERAGVFSVDPNSTVISMDISTSSSAPSQHNSINSSSYHQFQLVQKPSMLSRIRDVMNSIALFGSLAYACYMFYKRFIEPFLFGKKRKKTVEETLDEMDKKLDAEIKKINQELIYVRDEIKCNNQNDTITREFSNFKGDLDTIKGLLLNRKQFANPLPVVPPSIPAWQLTSQSHDHTETEHEHDKNDDAGSGSGSSETEVVTKNSDSSLEIM